MNISKTTKDLIIFELISTSYFSQIQYDEMKLQMLSEIIDLYNLPSSDPRFNNAYDDAFQHLVRNDDWDVLELFNSRFPLLKEDVFFIKFLNLFVNPKYCKEIDDIKNLVVQIERYLEKEQLGFKQIGLFNDSIPIYELVPLKEKDFLKQVPFKNDIPVHVILDSYNKFSFNNYHPIPKVFPAFNLALNTGWNDYGLISDYYLFYYDQNGKEHPIGSVKIISENLKSTKEPTSLQGIIPNVFVDLTITFCSLGQSMEYYDNLKNILDNKFESFMWAMKDCAFFNILHEKFELHPYFRSCLTRYDVSEQILREAKFKIYKIDLDKIYSFTYKFSPPFSDSSFDINIKFNQNDYYFKRIYGIIGKNGSGKTNFITNLPLDISNNLVDKFSPSTPFFSKVIALSYSAFDNFEIPENTPNFNYVYCGLKKNNNKDFLTDEELLERFYISWQKIEEQERSFQWLSLLSNFIENDLLSKMIIDDKFNFDSFKRVKVFLSSGQSLLLFIITELVANIRLNTLILYDEPETHLHPNAISQLINTIFKLLDQFQSFCIMTTHSPLIIRELVSTNVFIFNRSENYFSSYKIGIETFGENLTVLTDEVFGNRSINKRYKETLRQLVFNEKKSYEEIQEILTSSEVALSLNTSIYLQSLLDEKNRGLQ